MADSRGTASIRVPVLRPDEGTGFYSFKKRFRAYSRRQKYHTALDDSENSTEEQQSNLFADLLLAVPESDLSIFNGIDESDDDCGTQAWQALVEYYEDDGVYRINDLYDEFDRKQRPEETAIDYFNHLVRIRSELLAAGEELKESRVSGKLIAGLRDEYSTVTDSVDQNDGSFTLATTRRWIQQAGKRVESR